MRKVTYLAVFEPSGTGYGVYFPVIDEETAAGYLVSPITVFPDLVKNEIDNRRVKTNCTIPAWLKELAEQSGINYSQLLECALLDYLGQQRK